jgi:thiamine-phosphate diphosphorylase
VPDGFLIGYSTDDPDEARRAVAAGADYLGCGTVYGTSTKADAGAAIGLERLDEVAGAVPVPVVAIGGITPARAPEVARTRAAGVAVVGAVMSAADPGDAVRRLLAPFAARAARR